MTFKFWITFLSLKMPSMSTLQQYGPLSVCLTSRIPRSISPARTSPVILYLSETLEMTPCSSVCTRMLLHQNVPHSRPQHTPLKPKWPTEYWQDNVAVAPSITLNADTEHLAVERRKWTLVWQGYFLLPEFHTHLNNIPRSTTKRSTFCLKF